MFSTIADYYDLLAYLSEQPPDVLYKETRTLAQSDLFFLLWHICGRDHLEHQWLLERCKEVQAEPDGYLDLWSREHGKTSIITFGKTIQDIINDPEITVGLFSHTRPIAKSFLRQIMREFENNKRLIKLFPDILYEFPRKESPKWSEDEGLTVKRYGNPIEATVEAWGMIDGMPTGRHFKLRVYDDVVTMASVTSAEQIAKTTEAWEMSDNLGMIGGAARTIGTRYSLFDTYSEMLKRGAVKPRLYAATHNGRMDGKPVLFTQAEWERRLKTQSRQTVASQLLQNPMADEDATFSPLWLRPWEVRPKTLNVAILGDPNRKIREGNDNCALIVVGISSTGVKYLLDGYCHQMTLSQRWTALRNLYRQWSNEAGVQNIQVGYEKYGADADLEYFEERMRVEDYIFPIEEVAWTREGTGYQGKRTRVERLEPDFRNERFYLPMAVLHDGKACFWSIDRNSESRTYQSILYRPCDSLTSQQKRAVETGNVDLVCKSIRRFDENGKLYDLTEKFMQEYLYFPFGEFKDALDATSRVFDLDMLPPVIISKTAGEPPQYFDS